MPYFNHICLFTEFFLLYTVFLRTSLQKEISNLSSIVHFCTLLFVHFTSMSTAYVTLRDIARGCRSCDPALQAFKRCNGLLINTRSIQDMLKCTGAYVRLSTFK